MRVDCRQGVVEQIHIGVSVHSPGQRQASLLASGEIVPLTITQHNNINITCFYNQFQQTAGAIEKLSNMAGLGMDNVR